MCPSDTEFQEHRLIADVSQRIFVCNIRSVSSWQPSSRSPKWANNPTLTEFALV